MKTRNYASVEAPGTDVGHGNNKRNTTTTTTTASKCRRNINRSFQRVVCLHLPLFALCGIVIENNCRQHLGYVWTGDRSMIGSSFQRWWYSDLPCQDNVSRCSYFVCISLFFQFQFLVHITTTMRLIFLLFYTAPLESKWFGRLKTMHMFNYLPTCTHLCIHL